MRQDIIWSKDAGDELAEIISFIKYNAGKITAVKIYSKIINEAKRVSVNVAGRRIAPLLRRLGLDTIHQLKISPWIVFYKVEYRKMKIISIIDERRNLEEILYQKMVDGKII